MIQEVHLQTVTEVLQSIKASDMTPMLQRIFKTEGGSDALDVLMKYLYVPCRVVWKRQRLSIDWFWDCISL